MQVPAISPTAISNLKKQRKNRKENCMRCLHPSPAFTVPVLLSLLSLQAQSPASLTGHWEGAIQTPTSELKFEIDVAQNAQGELFGTIDIASQNLKGLPLLKVTLQARKATFYARQDQEFTGTLSPDGNSLTGELSIGGGFLNVNMTRAGEPKIAPPPSDPPIPKELEGTWNATFNAGGATLRLVLTLVNQPGGAATGRLVNLDEGNLSLPASRITPAAAGLTLDFQAVGASFTGTLSASHTELAGTYTQGQFSAPLTFRRAPESNK
jgi:hypothetical protein